MATQSISPTPEVTPPRVIPIPADEPHPIIAQVKLEQVLNLRTLLASLKEDLQTAEAEVTAMLEADAPVATGALRAYLKTVERRTVPWKQVVVRELGDGFAKRVLAATRPDRHVKLVVSA